jgi:hypothetical protein
MDRNLGAFDCVASNDSLPQESVGHVFLVAPCTYPLYATPNSRTWLVPRSPEFSHLRFAAPLLLFRVIWLIWLSARRRKNGAKIWPGRHSSG